MPSILFVGHDARRGGSQMELLHVLHWVKNHSNYRAVLLLSDGGEMLSDFEQVARTHILSEWSTSISERARRYLERRMKRSSLERKIRTLLAGEQFVLVYVNTVVPLKLVPTLARIVQRPVVCHVHELEMVIRKCCGIEMFDAAAAHVAAYVVASGAVEENLVRNHAIQRDRMHRVYEGISVQDFPSQNDAVRLEHRRALGIPENAFVVGGCGTMDWRKAPDIFVQVARRVALAATAPMHFVWVGGELDSAEFLSLKYDVERFGVEGLVHFVGPQADPQPVFSTFDVFFLTSREDPFPLVCLEAAALGLPIICFADAGGMPEFVEEDAGYVVPYLDVTGAADRVLGLAASDETRVRLGQRAAEKVRAGFDMKVTGAEILKVIQRYARTVTQEARV